MAGGIHGIIVECTFARKYTTGMWTHLYALTVGGDKLSQQVATTLNKARMSLNLGITTGGEEIYYQY